MSEAVNHGQVSPTREVLFWETSIQYSTAAKLDKENEVLSDSASTFEPSFMTTVELPAGSPLKTWCEVKPWLDYEQKGGIKTRTALFKRDKMTVVLSSHIWSCLAASHMW